MSTMQDCCRKNVGNIRHNMAGLLDAEDSKSGFFMPSQATAYKVGMLEILRLRGKAQTEFGNNFYIHEFHDFYLKMAHYLWV